MSMRANCLFLAIMALSLPALPGCMSSAAPDPAAVESAPSGETGLGPSTPIASADDTAPAPEAPSPPPPAPTAPIDAPTPAPTATPPPIKPARSFSTDVLFFAGSGTWSAEVSSLESILKSHGASYQMVSSAQLEVMSTDEIAKFGLLLFPGGSGGTQAGSLSSAAHARLRAAVQERGVSYIGFCAGAFIAAAPAPAPGKDVSYGLGIVDGPVLDYYKLENQGVTAAMTLETFADGTTRDLLWYGGPVTPDVKDGVVAKHPDGSPAISQMWSGAGFVILSGPHPGAPQSIRDTYGLNDSDGLDYDLAWRLVDSALRQAPLPHF